MFSKKIQLQAIKMYLDSVHTVQIRKEFNIEISWVYLCEMLNNRRISA